MADRRLAVVAGLLFCALVIMLLVVLYYPAPPDTDDNFEDLQTRGISLKSLHDFDVTEAPQPASKVAEAAKILENMGAGFLALLGVVFVSSGLACFTFACCCMK